MVQEFPGEIWKDVDIPYTNVIKPRLEISNFGRLRTTNKLYTRKILKGSLINGYSIIRIKLFKPADPQITAAFKTRKEYLDNLKDRILTLEKGNTNELEGLRKQLALEEKNLREDIRKYDLSRTINFHSLTHILVAKYFCRKKSELHTIVGHIDYNKLNNDYRNLRWMTLEENLEHQRSSPAVINSREANNGSVKLTVTKVKMLKKLLREGKSIKNLSKSFKVTDTQIKRIMRGENWKDVEAAP